LFFFEFFGGDGTVLEGDFATFDQELLAAAEEMREGGQQLHWDN
jgi:hypothetical protein